MIINRDSDKEKRRSLAVKKPRPLPVVRWGELIYRLLAPVHWAFPQTRGCEACRCRRSRWNLMPLRFVIRDMGLMLWRKINKTKSWTKK